MSRIYPPETREAARRLYAQGVGLQAISTQTGVAVNTVKSWTGDLPRQMPWKARDVLPPETKAEALRLARAGLAIVEIARAVGASYQTVKFWILQAEKNAQAIPDSVPTIERYRIADPALALALSGAWR